MHTKRLTHVLMLFVALAVFVPLYEHVTARPAHAPPAPLITLMPTRAATPAMASTPQTMAPIVPGGQSLL